MKDSGGAGCHPCEHFLMRSSFWLLLLLQINCLSASSLTLFFSFPQKCVLHLKKVHSPSWFCSVQSESGSMRWGYRELSCLLSPTFSVPYPSPLLLLAHQPAKQTGPT